MTKAIISILILTAGVSTFAKSVKPVYIVHVNLGNTQLSQNVINEVLRSDKNFEHRPVAILRPNLDVENNPFAVSKFSFQFGLTRQNTEIQMHQTPLLNDKMIKWFSDLERKNIKPDIFIINGHHYVGMGFQSDSVSETGKLNQFNQSIDLADRSLYLQTLIQSQKEFPVVKRFFESVKLVFIGGCEGLSNLEPKEFGPSGRALTPAEIQQRYLNGETSVMSGDVRQRTGLAYYKDDLVKTYPGEFTNNENEEVCLDKVNKLHCEIHDVNRILPVSGLWDGSHIYNMPFQMKKLFPNALGVFGFNTPSPRKPGPIWNAAFIEARKNSQTDNILLPLLSDDSDDTAKKQILQSLRVAWTKSTAALNKRYVNGKLIYRVSGSITPAFPDMDKNGIFAYEENQMAYPTAPKFAPYEIRGKNVVERKKTQKIKLDEAYKPKADQDPIFDLLKQINKNNEQIQLIEAPDYSGGVPFNETGY